MRDRIEYQSGPTVSQRAPIYIDVTKDPRARNPEYLNLYSSRIGAPVIAVDSIAGNLIGSAGLFGSFGGGGIIGEKDKPTPVGTPEKGVPPLPVENLQASWGTSDNIILTFTFDPNDNANQYIDSFKIKIKDSVTDKYYQINSGYGYKATDVLDLNSTSQTISIPWEDWVKTGIVNPKSISQVGVATADIIQSGEYVYANLSGYVSSLPIPEFTLTAGIDYYVVNITNLASVLSNGTFYGIIVEEYVSADTVKANIPQPQTMTNGWVQASTLTTNDKVVVYAPDEAHRWVRVQYLAKSGMSSLYTDIKDVTPLPFQPTNTNPSTQFTSGSIEWSGNNIKVNFVVPTTTPSGKAAPSQVKVKIVPYVNGVESTSLSAYYYHIITSGETYFTIPSLDLYGQFGTYYSTFKGYITAVSAQGVETTDAVIISGPITRSSSISNIYPTLGTPNSSSPSGIFRVTSITNGYVVEFDLPEGATRLEVYEKSSEWTTIPTDDTNMVYSGLSPATIITPDTNPRYVIVRYYDQYGGYSHYSMEKAGQTTGYQITPVDIGRNSLINNPIKISTDGSIFSGAGGSTVYPQVFFNKDGLFAYDSSGNWTTEIINSASSGAPTFITKRAVISDWTIAPTAIENTGYASGSTYTGLSASGTYAFWAGALSSKNTDGLANFSVTPAGQVVAKKITINGDGTGSDLIRAGGSKFIVNQNGDLTATSATLTGSLTVNQQSYFQSNVNVINGYIIAGSGGPNVGPNVQIDSTGLSARSASEVTTKIFSSPPSVVTVNNGTISGLTFWSKKALFGSTQNSGWIISDGTIISDYINLDSANNYIKIYSTTSNSYGLYLTANSTSNNAITVGNFNSPNFRVTHDGTLYASGAHIDGSITADQVAINSANYWNSGGFQVSAGGSNAIGNITLTAGIISSVQDDTDFDPDLGGSVNIVSYSAQIYLDSAGTHIYGIPTLGNYSKYQSVAGGGTNYPLTSANSNNSPYGMGKAARQRMLVMDPYDKKVYRGMAVYYGSRSTAPSAGTGVVGDLWVSWA